MQIFILSCAQSAQGGGIYKYRLSIEEGFSLLKYLPCDMPMYAVKDLGKLHVLLKEPIKNGHSGYFTANFSLDSFTDIVDTQGRVACHLAVDKYDNYIVNYVSGNAVKNCAKTVMHSGKGIHPLRQTQPHTHCAILSPDKSRVLVTDLGVDTVYVYDRGLAEVSRERVPDGYGIRHIVFSPDGKYVYGINELVPSISVFEYLQTGQLRLLHTQTLLCKNPKANGAAIRVSDCGKFLYCSVREENALFVYAIDGGKDLTQLQKTDCGGDSPRDFIIKDNILLCTNEKSDNVTVFTIDNGKISAQIWDISLKSPLCVL